jgi:hypothetical protein
MYVNYIVHVYYTVLYGIQHVQYMIHMHDTSIVNTCLYNKNSTLVCTLYVSNSIVVIVQITFQIYLFLCEEVPSHRHSEHVGVYQF